MIDKVKNTIDRFNMLTPTDTVVVGLSGGADSTALLLAMLKLGYNTVAVHVNHNLRGEESLRDELFCRELCVKLGVTLYVESVDVRAYCEETKTSLEEGARNLRYQAINKHLDGSKLATAHNINDCFETTLFNLTRGCSLSGIMGIPPVRDNIIRPLIQCTRDEIETFLNSQGQSWVTDSTNLVPDCSRNIIRLQVVPKLADINQGLYKTYASFLDTMSQTNDFVNSEIQKAYADNISSDTLALSEIPDGILRSGALKLYISNHGIAPSFDMIDLIVKHLDSNTKISLTKDKYIVISNSAVKITDSAKPDKLFVKTNMRDDFAFGTKSVHFTVISQFDMSFSNIRRLQYTVDADKLHGPVVARSVNGNEKIRLKGREFTSTVKKLFATLASPDSRHELVVLADDDGPFFAEGFGVDERVSCDGETSHAVIIDII